jgi:hypothetical protein
MAGGVAQRIENASWDMLTVPQLPQQIQFIALTRFVGLPEDFAEEADRRVRAELAGPGMDELVAVEFEVPGGEPTPDHPEGWEMNAQVPVVVEFTAEEPGPYTLTFYLNDRWAWSLPFRIATQ